jgi:hypothetical protein
MCQSGDGHPGRCFSIGASPPLASCRPWNSESCDCPPTSRPPSSSQHNTNNRLSSVTPFFAHHTHLTAFVALRSCKTHVSCRPPLCFPAFRAGAAVVPTSTVFGRSSQHLAAAYPLPRHHHNSLTACCSPSSTPSCTLNIPYCL